MGTTSLRFMNYVFYALVVLQKRALRKKCQYSELFWSVFSLIPTECGEIRSISSYSVWMRENADQNNSGCGHFTQKRVLACNASLTDWLVLMESHCWYFMRRLFFFFTLYTPKRLTVNSWYFKFSVSRTNSLVWSLSPLVLISFKIVFLSQTAISRTSRSKFWVPWPNFSGYVKHFIEFEIL